MLEKDSTKSRKNRNALIVSLAQWRACKNIPSPDARIPPFIDSPDDEELTQVRLDLNYLLVDRSASTYFVTVEGDYSTEIHDGDMLIVDRVAKVMMNDFVVARVNGELNVMRLRWDNAETIEGIWGKITYVIHCVK